MDRIRYIAEFAHEANRIICEANGDRSQPRWADAPQWMVDATYESINKTLAGATPEELHEEWCNFKRADGWVFGDVKDAEAKTHPCLVPYDDLPEMQRRKDALCVAVVRAMADALAE